MMMISRRPTPATWMSLIPPGLYFHAASALLVIARALFQARLIGGAGLSAALDRSHRLSRSGMEAWRGRRQRPPS